MPTLNTVQYTSNTAPSFKAVFTMDDGRTKTVKFGTASNYVMNTSKTKRDRTNYLKRHRVNEDWDDPVSRGALSRWILWGNSRSLIENINSYRKRFGV